MSTSVLICMCCCNRGCGHLRHIDAECGTLQSIDATFCGQLEGSGLARLIQGASFRIRTLLLSVCGSVSPSALSCLSYAHRLQTLDLSYTEIEVLTAAVVSEPCMCIA